MGAEATETRPRLHVGLKAGEWEKPLASLCFCSPVSGLCPPSPWLSPPGATEQGHLGVQDGLRATRRGSV